MTWEVTQINATVNGHTSATQVPLKIDNVSQGDITGGPHSIGPLTASGTSSKISITKGNGDFGLLQYRVKCTAPPGTLTINKVSLGGTGTFPVVATPTVGSAVNYPITTAGAPNGSGSLSQSVAADTYTISETPPAGWILDSIQCGNGPAGQTATAVVTANTTTTCTVTNRKKASVTIKKETNGGIGSFKFDATTVPAGQGAIAQFTETTTAANTPSTGKSLTDLVPGSYTFTETPPAGTWLLTTLTCDAGTGISGAAVNGFQGSFTLAPGASGTCTFKNTLQQQANKGTIIINKTAVGGDDTFPFTGTGTGVPANFSITTNAGTGSQTFPNLDPGTYTVTENVPAGWQTPPGLTCGPGGTTNGATATITIPPAGGTVTCTYTNTKIPLQGALTITKSASPQTFKAVGDVITYTYGVTNSGQTTVTGLSIDDNKIPAASITCLATTLAPGASTTCTGTYTITAADLSAGSVTNVAFAKGNDPNPIQSPPVTVIVKRDDDFIRDRTKEVIKNFLYRRADQLLSNEPDRNRLIRRLPGVLWGGGNSQTAQGGGTGSTVAVSGGQGETTRIAFATSLSQLAADARGARQEKLGGQMMGLGAGAGNHASLKDGPLPTWNSGFDLWVEGHYTHFDDDAGNADRSGRLGVMYGGVDYLVTPGLLIGALVQFDWMEDSSSTLNSSVDGNGWMAGPYMSTRLSENIFFDARAAWGESDNNISPFGTYEDTFETKRWLVRGNLTGNWNFGDWRLTPSVSVARIEEDQQAYVDSLGISIPGQNLALGRVTFGPEIGYRYFASDGSIIEPHMALQGLWDFEKPDTLTLGNQVVGPDDFRGKLQAGVMVMMPEGASVRATGSYDGIGSDDFHAYGGQMWVNLPLH